MTTTWMGRLVRARRIQQDAAQQQLADAQRALRRAELRARREDQRLDAVDPKTEEYDVPAFIAAAVALQAAAATHSAAHGAVRRASDETDVRRADLRVAAIAHDSAEELMQRALDADKQRLAHANQRDMDEIAAGISRRGKENP